MLFTTAAFLLAFLPPVLALDRLLEAAGPLAHRAAAARRGRGGRGRRRAAVVPRGLVVGRRRRGGGPWSRTAEGGGALRRLRARPLAQPAPVLLRLGLAAFEAWVAPPDGPPVEAEVALVAPPDASQGTPSEVPTVREAVPRAAEGGTLDLPPGLAPVGGRVEVALRVVAPPGPARSPREAGFGDDPRTLGLRVPGAAVVAGTVERDGGIGRRP